VPEKVNVKTKGVDGFSLSLGRKSRRYRDVSAEFGAPWMGDTKPERKWHGVSDKSARVESPRATGLSSVAFASGAMETHVLTGERNITPCLYS